MPGPMGGSGGIAMAGSITGLPYHLTERNYTLSGTTLDSNGGILGNVTVKLFNSATNVNEQTMVSSAFGAYSFTVDKTQSYYTVDYKVGPPDVYGSSPNTLVGS